MNRRTFIKDSALGVGATALAGVATQDADVAAQRIANWDRVSDVVIAGAGPSGLCAAIMARDQGASVLVIEQNHDIGGHAMVSGGRIPLGGGTRLQKKFGIVDSADQVYLDHTDPKNLEIRFSDRRRHPRSPAESRRHLVRRLASSQERASPSDPRPNWCRPNRHIRPQP
jgi:choline dehydrogenase-like flavoprotein